MIQKKAPFSGMFTPRVNNGDCVLSRQVIGTILFGDEFRQLANGSGEINNILSRQDVEAGAVLCEIDDGSTKCITVNNAFLSERLVKRRAISQKKKKKHTKKTSGKPAKIPGRSSSKKITEHSIRKSVSKATRKFDQKTQKSAKTMAKRAMKKPVKKIIRKTSRKK